jgi:hypothetical protein
MLKTVEISFFYKLYMFQTFLVPFILAILCGIVKTEEMSGILDGGDRNDVEIPG